MLDRRQILALLGSSAVVAAPELAIAADSNGGFDHGVASGDPAQDGAVIWTRFTPASEIAGNIALSWEVSEGDTGAVVRRGRVKARLARDFTAKVELGGLQPGREYRYRFLVPSGVSSATGRFRTLPVGALDRLDLAIACCQLYQGGYFHAFTEIARLEKLDAVIHLGDYIYEYGTDYPVYGGAVAERTPEPAHETVTLADYRKRHAQAKRDAALQAAHARAAFICAWDDHEFANNAFVSGASNHQATGEGPWARRKAAALQAWYEWMPVREPRRGSLPEAAYRAFRFGDLASLFMLETRLLARDMIPRELRGTPDPAQVPAGLAALRDPLRDPLGRRQTEWLAAGLAASVQAREPWQLVASQVIMAPVAGPDAVGAIGKAGVDALLKGASEDLRREIGGKLEAFRLGMPLNPDSWDGFPVARERLYRMFADSGSQPLVLSGDSHAFWANNLFAADGRLAARELGTTAVTSPGYNDALPGVPLSKLIASQNPATLFNDQEAKGFIAVRLTRNAAQAEFMAINGIKSRDYSAKVRRRFAIPPNGPITRI